MKKGAPVSPAIIKRICILAVCSFFFRCPGLGQQDSRVISPGDPAKIALDLIRTGAGCRRRCLYDQATSHLIRGLEIAKRVNAQNVLQEGYYNLFELHSSRGDFKKALDYFKLYSQTKEQIRSEHNDRIKKYLLLVFFLLVILLPPFLTRYRHLLISWKKKHLIDHYRLLDKIDSGGMGEVYRAYDLRNRSVTWAIKILKEDTYKDENCRKRFKSEAAFIDQLDHPNIVRIFKRGEYHGRLYMVMELLEGKNLREFLENENRLELKTALSIMIQIADALKEIHQRGIIHRDLKPENIMVLSNTGYLPQVKLLDFGLARFKNQPGQTGVGMIMGTIFYLSPEQLSGARASFSSDIYALGVLYYQLLTGKKPFPGNSAGHIATQIIQAEPLDISVLNAAIPPRLSRLVQKMMAKDPRKRLSVKEVIRRLRVIENSLPQG